MEVVYALDENYKTIDKDILGLYGDITYLDNTIETYGISYKDTWTVKRFLNGLSLKLNSRIKDIFNYLDLDIKYLDCRICDLSHTIFKYVMLSSLLLNNMRFIILDHFDAGLTYKAQKKLINVINKMKDDGFNILVISNNFVFLSKAVDRLSIVEGGKEVFDGSIDELLLPKNRKYIKNTKIIDFIDEANEHKAKLKYTFDRNELLEDIYRSVG